MPCGKGLREPFPSRERPFTTRDDSLLRTVLHLLTIAKQRNGGRCMRQTHLTSIVSAFACGAVVGFPSTVRADPVPGGTFDPTSIPKYQTKLLIPPVMPVTGHINQP